MTALQNAALDAREKSERHIAFVPGVPGSGKTLVGLQFVYSTKLSDNAGDRPAVFLSGNGPLVSVLQDALQNRIFVQDVHGFLLRYGGLRKTRLPEEHVWVYDEAQRAWDSEQVKGKRGHDLSEPDDFLRLGMRMPQWSMLVGLIGEGQEIHLGEEAGLRQWDDAIGGSGGDWIVHCPARVAEIFPQRNVQINDALDLSTSLRSHVAGDLHEWVASLLAGDIHGASRRAGSFSNSAFNLYILEIFTLQQITFELDTRTTLISVTASWPLRKRRTCKDLALTRASKRLVDFDRGLGTTLPRIRFSRVAASRKSLRSSLVRVWNSSGTRLPNCRLGYGSAVGRRQVGFEHHPFESARCASASHQQLSRLIDARPRRNDYLRTTGCRP